MTNTGHNTEWSSTDRGLEEKVRVEVWIKCLRMSRKTHQITIVTDSNVRHDLLSQIKFD